MQTARSVDPAGMAAAAAQVAAREFEVDPMRVLGGVRRRARDETSARWLAIYLAHTSGGVSLKALAAALGCARSGRGGLTQIVQAVEEARDDPDFEARLARMEETFALEIRTWH